MLPINFPRTSRQSSAPRNLTRSRYCGTVTVTADECCNVPEVPVTVMVTAFEVGVDGVDEDCFWVMPPPPQPMCDATRTSNSMSSTAICHFLRRPAASNTTPKTGKAPNHIAK